MTMRQIHLCATLRLGEGGGLLGGDAKLLVLVLQLIELDEAEAAHSEQPLVRTRTA